MKNKFLAVLVAGTVVTGFGAAIASASGVLTPHEMEAVRGGCSSYCLSEQDCGGPIKGCSSKVFGESRCDPNDPNDCYGGESNKCETTLVHSACNSTNPANPLCVKRASHNCGRAYWCECRQLQYGNYKCEPIDDDPDTTCGHYEEADPPC